MSNLAIEVDGFPELLNKIKQLSNDKDKRREMLALLREVAKPTLQAARLLVPKSKRPHYARKEKVSPGTLKKALGLITGKSDNPTILVGPRAKGNNKGWYGHFVHDGVNVYNKGYKRKRTKGANGHAAVSRTPGNPYLTNAYQATSGRVTPDAEVKMARYIQRKIDKLS